MASLSEHLQSMTGFARSDGGAGGTRWTWELRSVNGKGLDLRFRGPPGFDAIEPQLRERAAGRFSRGSIQAQLTVARDTPAAGIRINRPALDALITVAEEYRERTGSPPVGIEALLAIRGVVEAVEAESDPAADIGAVLASLDGALDALANMRRGEGAAIAAVLRARLDRIETLAIAAADNPARTPEAIRARLAEQVARLVGASSGLDPDRLHQEAVMLAARADIREEIDRLVAHVAAARELLVAGGPAGRKLDFLAQEFNRETNTLCAKANDVSLTAVGLELKAVVDQFREQVQNLE